MDALARLGDLLAWPLRTADYVELGSPLWGDRVLRAEVAAVREETPDARTLTLRPSRAFRQAARPRAGQYLPVGVVVDGRRHQRTYSISSDPERPGGTFDITVKAVPGGVVSTHLVRHGRPGDVVTLGLPAGDFTLPRSVRPSRILFVTAGSGVTPVMGLLRTLAATGEFPDVTHLHYAPTPGEAIFGDALRRLAEAQPRYRRHALFTRTPDAAPRLSSATLDALCPDWPERETWACGPDGLLTLLHRLYCDAGASTRLHIERFAVRLAVPPAGVLGGTVRFTRSNVEVTADGAASLLHVAEEAGVDPPSGCRIGICHTCTTTLVSGCVTDLRNTAITREPGARVQLCVSAPSGPVELAL